MGRKAKKIKAIQEAQKKKKAKKIRICILAGAAVLLVGAAGLFWRQRNGSQGSGKDYDPSAYVTLGQYDGIPVSLEVTEEDLQDEIDSVLEEHSSYEQLSGTTQTGQTIYASFEGYVDGQKIDVTCGSDYVELGSGEWLDGFEQSLTGVNTGESVVFTVAVPDGTYSDASVDGKDVEFHADVQYICGEEIQPEYSDEFVQSISKKYKTTKEYSAHLKEKLQKENEEQKAEYAWSDVLELCKVNGYPKSLLKACKKEVLQGYYDMAEVYGCSREEIFPQFGYASEEEFVQSDLKPLAKDTAKEYLVSEAIAEKENISYTQEAFTAFVKEQYEGMTAEYDTQEKYLDANRAYLERQMLMEQVKQWIAEHAQYSE